ncbi:hypothetical protein M758_11G005800 [Ceratodon purpureus]|nr:hypothetical protein M758_11G005800 [Ceratodon purpureus]
MVGVCKGVTEKLRKKDETASCLWDPPGQKDRHNSRPPRLALLWCPPLLHSPLPACVRLLLIHRISTTLQVSNHHAQLVTPPPPPPPPPCSGEGLEWLSYFCTCPE